MLQIGDGGPTLRAGAFRMRVSNAGILGNAFTNVSSDPSFEFPRGSGNEMLNSLAFWVGGVDEQGMARVSGGPMLEWRPTTSPADTVREYWLGQPGTRWAYDDDGDGRVDEEIPNGIDDDGDGEIDEDIGLSAQQMLTAEYTDDQPAAINYGYPAGERHVPLGLSVHQEAFTWANPGFDQSAGLRFVVTNHGSQTIRNVYLGVYADLDARGPNDPTGHMNDLAQVSQYVFKQPNRPVRIRTTLGDTITFMCISAASSSGLMGVVSDGIRGSGLPMIAIAGLEHTTDPLASIPEAAGLARAPATSTFNVSIFSRSRPWEQGGPPLLDADRYEALQGKLTTSLGTLPDDQIVLVSCGPFSSLAPGQTLEMDAAIGAAFSLDSLRWVIGRAAYLERGMTFNLLPDSATTTVPLYTDAATGIAGHELCLEAPPGHAFTHDPDCPQKFSSEDREPPPSHPALYQPGHCVWTDADCNPCTGSFGEETLLHWMDPGAAPPAPTFHAVPGDHDIRVLWDNLPEILVRSGVVGSTASHFLGYRLWRLQSWGGRGSPLPPDDNWALVASYACDSCSRRDGQLPLSSITDTTLDYVWITQGQRQYPPGRYVYEDRQAKNGFDYMYAVTTVYQLRIQARDGAWHDLTLESPIVPAFSQRVTARVEARDAANAVWVVPNPYRANAPWERPPVPGDAFTRHLDFMGLPRAVCTIRIYTVAGDLVQVLHHDGSSGDGEAAWDLISRNGQDIASGIYLFTVDSALGHQVGRFVVIR